MSETPAQSVVTEHPILGRLAEALGGRLPSALQQAAGGDPVPLAIGSGDVLQHLLIERGLPEEDAGRLARGTLRKLTRSLRYREAICDEDAWRHDLNGNRVERVDSAHALVASTRLLARELGEQNKRARQANGDGKRQPKPEADPGLASKPPITTKPAKPAVAASRRPGVSVRRW